MNGNFFLDDQAKEQFLNDLNAVVVPKGVNLRKIGQFFVENPEVISEVFNIEARPLNIKREFQAYCKYDIMESIDGFDFQLCSPESVFLGIQLTFQIQ